MTTIIQLEGDNWYAEGVAIMDNKIYGHPIMQNALDRIAKELGFDREVGFERDIHYEQLHRLIDDNVDLNGLKEATR
ncbi:hypothetical protein K227x_58810 [Rubripirellula lacrimiformis]|uniref:Uncharacterized protein n=1 Tax=Rubripirellula lacrimiformis TaxID=1930273 RepID=A0A517NJZ0_9BACT|nr:hypothetical protein [Rubripirellula lacrimiformis]QDT07454.1 hypothetical protein K227x_58810 [Rubripirellula lacrimiformis]